MQVGPVCPNGQKEAERRKNGLALGNPSDGFDVERMYCEEEGCQDAAAEIVGGGIEKQKKENHVAGVKKDAREMMTGSVAAEHRDIRHMREPSEGMPVCFGSGCERPAHVGKGQASQDVGILGDVGRVVVIDETISDGASVEQQSEQEQ